MRSTTVEEFGERNHVACGAAAPAVEKLRFGNEHGDKPINRLGTWHISEIIGAKADTPEAANNLLTVLRVLLGYAVTIEVIESNPALGVKRFKGAGRGFPYLN